MVAKVEREGILGKASAFEAELLLVLESSLPEDEGTGSTALQAINRKAVGNDRKAPQRAATRRRRCKSSVKIQGNLNGSPAFLG